MKPGDTIVFAYKKEQMSGTIVTVADLVTIKLDSGYNIVVKKADVKTAKVTAVQTKKNSAAKPTSVSTKSSPLPKIKILHTGGTIASKVDYATGAVTAKFTEQDILSLFPELSQIANISSTLVGNMQSEMMRFGHWNLLAKEVEAAIKDGAQGVIVTHGTDILHMSAAALSFALENCPIPVLVVGCQRSSDRPSSDAASNLLCAATFIAQTCNQKKGKELTHALFQGVGVCLHESIENDDCIVLPATRCRKMHTSRRDAFKAINDSATARISYPALEVTALKPYPQNSDNEKKLQLKLFNEKLKIGLCTVHPHMFAEELSIYKKFDGLVLSVLGIGHAPTVKTDKYNAENAVITKTLQDIAIKIPIVAAPQTLFGRVNMQVYSPGRQLLDIGVLGQGCDMTPETAFVKLAWLLSNHKKDVATLYAKNLRGELSACSPEEGFLE